MLPSIDVDRGVSIRQIVKFDEKNPRKFEPDATYGGLTIYMYKNEPGVYYDVHGKKLPEALAKKAGFDTSTNAKLRKKRAAMADFEKQMAEALALEVEEEEVLAQKGDWKVVALPMDRAKIVDVETGDTVTAVPMPRKDALMLLDNLVDEHDDVEKINKGKEK
jgi:hypothetical protein